MPDPHSTMPAQAPGSRPRTWHSLVDRMLSLVRREPEDRADILSVLELAQSRNLIDANAYSILKGALTVSDMTADDIMVPRARINMLDVDQPLSELIPKIVESGHSRLPVYEGTRDNVIGMFMVKDILRCMIDPQLGLRDLLRPAVFIPESKRVNVLLQEFRANRNHIALVIDEHGGITGLVTMEDVLEQIVGTIEDEFDDSEQTIFPDGHQRWRVMASTELDVLEPLLGCTFDKEDCDTLGGWLTQSLGHIPKRGDQQRLGPILFQVLRADSRRALWVRIQRLEEQGSVDNGMQGDAGS